MPYASELASLRERHDHARREAAAILAAAEAASRAPSADEEARFDELLADAERASRAIEHLTAATSAADLRRRHLGGLEGTTMTTTTDEIRDLLRSNEREATFTISPDAWATRAITNADDGGAFRPTDFASFVSIYSRTATPWLNPAVVNVISADNGRDLVLPRVTADQTVYKPGEGTATTESDPTMTGVTLTTTAYRVLTHISNEAIEDASVNLTAIVAQQAGRAIGESFGSDATTAIVAAATNGGTATGTPFFGLDDVQSLYFGATAPDRAAGSFVLATSAMSKISKFTTDDGAYLWQPAVSAGTPRTLLGAVAYEDANLPSVGSASKSLLFGDTRSAIVVKTSPIRVRTTTDYKLAEDLTSVSVVWRIGVAVVLPSSVRYLVSANS